MEADDIAIFADEATSLARKEMMGLFVSAYDEKNKRVVVEYVSIATVSSTQLKLVFLALIVPMQSPTNILV